MTVPLGPDDPVPPMPPDYGMGRCWEQVPLPERIYWPIAADDDLSPSDLILWQHLVADKDRLQDFVDRDLDRFLNEKHEIVPSKVCDYLRWRPALMASLFPLEEEPPAPKAKLELRAYPRTLPSTQ